MLDANFSFINEEFHATSVSPEQLDMLLADGWRHFGTHFFRYNLGFYESDIRRVMPMRIRLAEFSFSKSQRRVLRKNEGLTIVTNKLAIDGEAEELFHRHKRRFKGDVPNAISDFLGTGPSPVDAREMRVLDDGRLQAASYFDVGGNSLSGVYAMFEPEAATRSLGIFTMLKEIEIAAENNKEFYYLGYVYEGRSFYDYKKRFSGTEMFDWNGNWLPFEEPATSIFRR
ncbi:MAG: arginine-tRNA-protein transferase [Acidobacteriota bacterium]